MGQAENVYNTPIHIPATGNEASFSPCIIDPLATITDLWALRLVAVIELQKYYAAEDAALARGAPLAEMRRLEEATDLPYDHLWNIDWSIIQTKPRSRAEHAIQVQVLEMRICPDDGTVPEDFLRAYCATIRQMALA